MPPVTVTFTPSNPQNKIVCNPNTVPVPYGNNQTVTWNLVGPSGAKFATDGIYFKDASPGTLQRLSDTSFQLTDNNANTTGSPIDYPYGIKIEYNNQPYEMDPQVENETRPTMTYHPA
ncbi:MAG TPA: hypothetical protein VF701_02415 [Thermoanaerobaculia bacterium]